MNPQPELVSSRDLWVSKQEQILLIKGIYDIPESDKIYIRNNSPLIEFHHFFGLFIPILSLLYRCDFETGTHIPISSEKI